MIFYMGLMFAERLKTLRKEKGIRQEQLALSLGVTQRKISYWETGQTEPDLLSILKISEYFGVTCDYLLGKTDY